MSESSHNQVITESITVSEPIVNAYDNTNESYQNADSQQSLETALDEKRETEDIENKIEELEASESQESQESQETEETEETEKEDQFSSKFAALSRREKALREREYQIEQKIAQMEERMASFENKKEVEPEPETVLPLEYRLKRNPLETLSELGLSYDKLTQLALNDGKLTTDMQMDLMRQEIDQKYSSELEQLRSELSERDKRMEEEKYNEVVTNFKSELTNFINDTDQYELIRANDAVDVVYDVIEQHYNDTGRILSKDEAANQVESYLEEEVEKLLKLNKLRSKLGTQEAVQQTKPTEPKQVQKAPTLSNAHSVAASKPSRPLTREESLAQAAAMLKWKE